EIHPVQVLFLGKDQTLSFTATGGTGETERKADSERLGTSRWLALQYLQSVGYDVKFYETPSRKSISIDMPDTRRRGRIGTGRDYSAYQGEFRQDQGADPGSIVSGE